MRSRRRLQPGRKLGERHGQLPVHGESRFPQQRDYQYQAFVRSFDCALAKIVGAFTRSELAVKGWQPCGHLPERSRVEFAHVLTKGAGNPDRANGWPACPVHHDEQEGRTKQFCARYGIDLYEIAAKLDADYVATSSHGESR